MRGFNFLLCHYIFPKSLYKKHGWITFVIKTTSWEVHLQGNSFWKGKNTFFFQRSNKTLKPFKKVPSLNSPSGEEVGTS